MITLPIDREARIVRIREGAAQPDDLMWLRITESPSELVYRCDCRCCCHSTLGAAAGSRGVCDRKISLDTLDCDRACRATHYLASECNLDETRGAGIHV